MRKICVLIIEDDVATMDILESSITDNGHLVHTAKNLEEGYSSVQQSRPDLIIMDRGLPDGDGIRLCLTLRKDSRFRTIPILMLTGKNETCDKVLGLRVGADDYLAKPFDMEELFARMDALIRRIQPGLASCSDRLVCGGIVMDISGRQVMVNGEIVQLANMEYELLRILLERAGTALSREFLLESVWKATPETIGAKTVDVTVMNLRKKLGKFGELVVAVPSCGYKIRTSEKRKA